MLLNWVDWIIVAVVVYHLFIGWQIGLVKLGSNLISFLIALWFAIKFNDRVGLFFVEKFGIPMIWSAVVGYIVIAFTAEAIISELLSYVVRAFPKKFLSSKTNQSLGAFISAANGIILISFFLLVVLAFPVRGTVKRDVKNSVFGSAIVTFAEKYGGSVKSSLEQASQQAVKFLTVEPASNESIELDVDVQPSDLTIDDRSEQLMVDMVNRERTKIGVGTLRVDTAMITVSRNYSKEMFERKFFAHVDPDGHDATYRMSQAHIPFQVVGENLAYAPDLSTAHTGLMNSEGHRRNILDPQFHRIGIGIIDAGVYGKMFTQLFAD